MDGRIGTMSVQFQHRKGQLYRYVVFTVSTTSTSCRLVMPDTTRMAQ
jgi:hypothetical protein